MSTAVPANPISVIQGRPSTFAERGVTVPFTTPILAQARIRPDRYEQLEVLLPGFSGGKATYVFSWKTIPEVLKITLHDRALHKEIMESGAKSPDEVRLCSLNIAARGFAGLAAASQAKAALAQDQQYIVLTNYIFVLELLKLVGVKAPDLLKTGLGSNQAQQIAKDALNRVAAGFKMPSDELYTRVEDLSYVLSPLGLPQAPRPGRLRQLIERIERTAGDLAAWSTTETTEASDLANFVTDCAQQTLAIARSRIARLDPRLTRMKDIVTGQGKILEEITHHITTLSWLLDGWDYICQIWEDSKDQSEDMQRIAVCEVFRIAPIIPTEEVVANEQVDMESLRKVQRRWVKSGQDWRGVGLDYDSVGRIETIKARLG